MKKVEIEKKLKCKKRLLCDTIHGEENRHKETKFKRWKKWFSVNWEGWGLSVRQYKYWNNISKSIKKLCPPPIEPLVTGP